MTLTDRWQATWHTLGMTPMRERFEAQARCNLARYRTEG